MTKVLGDILLALDDGNISMLTLLDLSAAFGGILWTRSCSAELVAVFPRQPNSVSLLWQFDLGPSYSLVWGPARLGSRTVYSGPAEADRKL